MPISRSDHAPARPRARTRARLALAGITAGLAATFLLPAPATWAAECTQVGVLRFCNPGTVSPTRAPAPAPTTTLPPAPTAVKMPSSPTTLPAAPAPPPPPAVAGPDVAGARKLLEIVNAERAGRGLGTLSWRDDVAAIAAAHSQRMASAGTIFHNDSFFSAQTKSALGARTRGENVAMNTTMESTHLALMNSSGHRANLLNPAFNVVGFAVVRNANGVAFVTQNFIQSGAVPAATEPVAARPAGARRAAAGSPPAKAAGPVSAPHGSSSTPPTAAGGPAPQSEATPDPQPAGGPVPDLLEESVELALPPAPVTPSGQQPSSGTGRLVVPLVASGIAVLATNPFLLLARRRYGLMRLARLVTRR